MTTPTWTTACPDWERRIVAGESLIPHAPLFSSEADAGLRMFRELKVADMGSPGNEPTLGSVSRPFMLNFVASIFGAYDPYNHRRLIREWFLLISKKNGKALALDTPIPTPAGWATMGELEIGDTVFGADGAPCRVIATSPVFEDHPCYRVSFSNNDCVTADAGHFWVTSALSDQGESAVRTTEQIAATLLRADGARNHSLPMPAPIMGRDIELPVAPYTLGAWLGDGHSAAARLTCAREDQTILESIRADGWPVRETSRTAGKASTYSLSDGDRSQAARSSGLASKLRAAGVLHNKHIPGCYLRASFEQRLALLQGLMDTDGTVNKNGRVLAYTSVNLILAASVAELLATFGIKFTWCGKELSVSGRKVPGTGFTLQFMAFRDELAVFRLPRKLSRMRLRSDSNRAPRSRSVQITAVDAVASVPVKCITVDSPDHQFLFGRTMLPTHNSTNAAGIMMTALLRNWRASGELGILAPTVEVANNAFGPARDMVRADEELSALLHVQDHIRTITHRETGAKLQVVAADTEAVAGKKWIVTLVDELWIFGKRANAANMLLEATGGMASRPEGFVIYLSTQSDEEPAGVFKQKLEYARGVRDGAIHDPEFMPVLYEWPRGMLESEAYLDPKNFYITNPNLGASVDERYIQRKLREAAEGGEETNQAVLAKHLNVEIGQRLAGNRWAGADQWEACGTGPKTLEELIERSEVVVAGIDGGGLDDLLGFAVVGREQGTGEWLHWGRAWAHDCVLKRRKSEASKFRDFEKAGDLIVLPDDSEQDIQDIAELIGRLEASGLLDRIGVDQAGIGAIVDAIAGIGIDPETRIISIPQGWKLMGAIKTAERKLAARTLRHAGQPLLTYSVGNAKVEARGNAVMITKQKSGTAKIDPLMALFDACALMAMNPKPRRKQYQMLVFG